jgi:uncharacterized protein YndB with AHSA1/START domain
MGAQRFAIWIAVPPERVYDLYTDLERVAEWQDGNPRVTDISGDPNRAGTTYTVRRGPLASRSEVILAERPIRHVVRVGGPIGLHAEVSAQFAPEGQGTRFTVGLQAEWRFALLGRMFEWVIFNPRTAHRELGKLKAIAERDVQGTLS